MPVCVIGKLLIAIRETMLALYLCSKCLRLNQYYPQPDLRLRRCNPVFVIGIAIRAQTRFRSVPHAMVLNFPNQPAVRKHAVGDFCSIWTFSPNQPAIRKHAVGDYFSICTFSPNQPAIRKYAVEDFCLICTFSPNQPAIRKYAVGDFCSIWTFSPNWLAFRKLAVIGKILRISS